MASSTSRYAIPAVSAVIIILVALAVIQQLRSAEEAHELAESQQAVATAMANAEATPTTTTTPSTSSATTPTPTPTSPTTTPTTTTSTAPDTYKDGTYTATGHYMSPAGAETILVTVAIKDDKIESAAVVAQANNPASKNWQDAFIAGFQTVVLGKKVDEVSVTKVSGSSLTPKGFNDALAQIKTEAHT